MKTSALFPFLLALLVFVFPPQKAKAQTNSLPNQKIASFGKDNNTKPGLLLTHHPNPFSRSTTIYFTLLKASKVNIAVYDISGKLVDIVYHGQSPSGQNEIVYTPKHLKEGTYIYLLQTGDMKMVQKMVYQKK